MKCGIFWTRFLWKDKSIPQTRTKRRGYGKFAIAPLLCANIDAYYLYVMLGFFMPPVLERFFLKAFRFAFAIFLEAMTLILARVPLNAFF